MNRDGTIDSICPLCYRTIGSAIWEADLERMEQMHMCEPEIHDHVDAVRELATKRSGGSGQSKSPPVKRLD